MFVLPSVKFLFSCATYSARRAHCFFIRKPGNQETKSFQTDSWIPGFFMDFRLRLRRAGSFTVQNQHQRSSAVQKLRHPDAIAVSINSDTSPIR
jgi:hypothetical protein